MIPVLAQAMLEPPAISWIGIGPEVALGVGAAVILLVEVQWHPSRRLLGGLAGAILVLAAGLAVALHRYLETSDTIETLLPFGGMIALDGFGVFVRYVLLAVAGLGLASGWRMIEAVGTRAAEMLALALLATAGFSLMGISSHLMMTFLGLEVGSIALYVLAGFQRDKVESDEAAIKYFLLGAFASAIFVYGVALVFAGTGTFSLVGIRQYLTGVVLFEPGVILIGLGLVIVGLAFKVTAAPFHSWAPDVYQGSPAGVVGFMAAAAKIGGFAALVRVLATAFPALADDWGPVVAGVSALSMVLGSVLAIVQEDLRRLLAYSGVAHAGFILTGVVAGQAGIADVLFYLAIYTIQLVAAFAVVAAVSGATGVRSALSEYSGLAERQPFMAVTFSVILLGMGGLPLTSGFMAKFGVFTGAWAAGYEWLVIVGLVAGVVALFLYLRVIVIMFMDDPAEAEVHTPAPTRWVLGVVAAVTILFGILPGPLLDLASRALPL